MTRHPILVARSTFGLGLVLLAAAITAIALQGFSDWALPLAITVNGAIWTRRVHKYGSIFPAP
jgi:hypothetical protein